MVELIIFTTQLLLVFFKYIAIRAILKNSIFQTLVFTFFIQSCWLISSALGINALLNYEWLSVISYIAGGILGSYLQFKIKLKGK
jgi:hypothetical protein